MLRTKSLLHDPPRVLVLSSLALISGLLLRPSLAIAELGVSAPPEPGASKVEIGSGELIGFPDLEMSVRSIEGWELNRNQPGMTLAMQDLNAPKLEIGGLPTSFQRNLTVVAKHRAMPIDQVSMDEFVDSLTQQMQKDALVKDFRVVEQRFFNHRKENDGILVYTAMTLGKFPMMQAYVVVSGENNHIVLTYTDLAERFVADKDVFAKVWSVMSTIEVSGFPKHRLYDLAVWGGSSLLAIGLMAVIALLRKRRANQLYTDFSDSVYDDDGVSSGVNGAQESYSNVSSFSSGWGLDEVKTQPQISSPITDVKPKRSKRVAAKRRDAESGWTQSSNVSAVSFVSTF